VCFEGCDFLRCIVVVNAELEIIGTTDNPILPGDETAGSDRDISKFECLDN